MPMPELPPEPPRPVEGLPTLRSVDRYPLPVSQKVVVPLGSVGRVSTVASALLQQGRFTLITLPREPVPGNPGSPVADAPIFAERSAQRMATHISMLATVGVLVGAGVSLGAVDALVFGNVLYALPWVAVGVVGAGVLWWRYGRGYESEVVAMHFTETLPAAGPSGPATTVSGGVEAVWSAGRVRSVLFAGTRTVVGVVDCPISLMRTLGGIARRFEAELAAPSPPVPQVPARSTP